MSLLAEEGLLVTLTRAERRNLKVKIRHKTPVSAPIRKNSRLGEILVMLGNETSAQIPLIAGENVHRLGPSGRFSAALSYLLWGTTK